MKTDDWNWIFKVSESLATGALAVGGLDVERLRRFAPECGLGRQEIDDLLSEADGPLSLFRVIELRTCSAQRALSAAVAELYAAKDPVAREGALARLREIASSRVHVSNRREAEKALSAARDGLV